MILISLLSLVLAVISSLILVIADQATTEYEIHVVQNNLHSENKDTNNTNNATTASPLSSDSFPPIVLWHGMGDTCCNERSLGAVKKSLEEHLSGVYVYSIRFQKSEDGGDKKDKYNDDNGDGGDDYDADEDRKRGYLGNINEQVESLFN